MCFFLSKNESLPLIISVMLSPTVTAVKKSHSYLLGSSLELECKLTSWDLKYKRSLLPQIKSWETLAKLMSTSSSAGTSGGGGVRLPPHSRGWPHIVLSRGHLPRSQRPPGPWPLHPDHLLLLVCRPLGDFEVRRTPTRGTQSQDPAGPSSWLLPTDPPCRVVSGQGTTEGPWVSPSFSTFSCVPTPGWMPLKALRPQLCKLGEVLTSPPLLPPQPPRLPHQQDRGCSARHVLRDSRPWVPPSFPSPGALRLRAQA